MVTKLEVTPIGKPRMTQRDKWKKRPAVVRYYEYKDALNLLVKGPLPERLNVVFYIPMPSSWSKKKKAEMCLQPHKNKPDIDNLIKAFTDCLAVEDSYIHEVHAWKIWDIEGKIIFGEITGE